MSPRISLGCALAVSLLLPSPGYGQHASCGSSFTFLDDLDGDDCAEVAFSTTLVDGRDWSHWIDVRSGKTGTLLRRIDGAEDEPYFGGGPFGHGLASLGDVDDDGHADLLVTTGAWATKAIRAVSATDGRRLWSRAAEPGQTGFMYAVIDDVPGDEGGDGVRDIALLVATDDGRSLRVVSGRDGTGLSDADLPRGDRVFALGDCDGDGLAEVAVSTVGSHVDVLTTRGRALFTLSAPGEDSVFGTAVAAAGDLDADGVPDLAVGAGSVLLYSGATGKPLGEIESPDGYVGFGHALIGPGDLDGDGTPDLVATRLGFLVEGVWRISGADLSPQRVEALQQERNLGWDVRSGGDANGDGVPDLLVGVYSPFSRFDKNVGVIVLSGKTGEVLRRHWADTGD